MKRKAKAVTITTDPTQPSLDWPELSQQRRAIVVVDVVESVRLMQANETDVIDRWRRFVSEVRTQVLPAHGGRLVKSLGDGLLLEFASVPPAVAAALEVQRRVVPFNAGREQSALMALRIGIHIADVVFDDLDVYGAGVNLAARLTELARPGETVVSIEVRDLLADGVQVDVEDLGECFVKHLPHAVRAFRLQPTGLHRTAYWPAPANHFAVLAVVPFAPSSEQESSVAIGDALADDIIAALSLLDGLQLISRLSTSRLRNSNDCLSDCRRLLGAKFVLSGHYSLHQDHVRVRCSLVETTSEQVLWSGGHDALVGALFAEGGGFLSDLVAEVGKAIVRQEVRRTRGLPIPTLENFTLYIGGITLMHRMSQVDFQRARVLFEQLTHRLPRNSAPKAMMAKWYLMRMLQGWSSDLVRDGQLAHDMARRALDHDPEHPFALATEGFVAAHFAGDLSLAQRRCEQALESNPQEAQAWRMKAAVHSYFGDGEEAESCAERALSLTPLDPTRFIFELIVGVAKLSRGRYVEAVGWADKSLRQNAMHVPTHRLRVIALALAGFDLESKEAAKVLLGLSPGFRINAFAQTYPGREQPHALSYFAALRRAGLPE
jgi:adenylate cyclase